MENTMIQNHEHIYQMLLKKRNGTISQEDDAYIVALMERHDDIALMWRALKHSFSLPGEEYFWQEIDEDHAWQQVRGQLVVKKSSNWWRSSWMMAAVFSAVALTGISYVWTSGIFRKEEMKHHVAVTPNSVPGLQLTMANGETVDLPYNQPRQQIDAGDVQLSAGARKLQYTGKGTTGFNTLTVPPKMDYKLVLADGSEVWLNATSKLRFPFAFTGDKREVYLEGEGYFTVTKDEAHPFIVHTGKTDITVLGTTFNVNAYANGMTSTALVSGKVISSAGKESVALQPGQQAVLTSNNTYNVEAFDADEVLAWMRGVYLFHNTSLQNISAVIERWYGVKVVFDDPALAARKFTGGLEKLQTLDYFLETLQIISNVEHYYDKGILHLHVKPS